MKLLKIAYSIWLPGMQRGLKTAINRLPGHLLQNGVKAGWLNAPGVIAGVSLNVNLQSLDRFIKGEQEKRVSDSFVVEQVKVNPLGLIPFILEKFAFKKTAKLDSQAMHKRLESLIGSAQAKSHRHSLVVTCSVPESQIVDSLRLLGELLEGPGE